MMLRERERRESSFPSAFKAFSDHGASAPTVDPNQIADPGSTAVLPVAAFPYRIAYPRHCADLGPHVCRDPIADHPGPLLRLRLLSL
jgi:hypothetical protein